MKQKKLLSLICVIAMCLGLLAGCGDYGDDYNDDDYQEETDYTEDIPDKSKPSGQNAKWTIMLYLCGTDLESNYQAGTLNIQEILNATASDDINFVIETGGSSSWDMDGISTDVLSRFVKKGNELELVATGALARMSDVNTYTDFLTWATNKYPADKYMLVVWDHGMGSVDGVIYDELYDENQKSLSVKEIAQGIAATGKTFEIVGFDACLMSTLEQASALCPYARYMVASEETEPGAGWDYTTWLNYLTTDTGMSGAKLGTKIVDSFYDKCAASETSSDCTLAVTDLSKIPTLVEDFNAMAKEMKGFTSDTSSVKVITGAFKTAENYGGNNAEEDYTDMVDLGDLILNAKGILSKTGEKVLNDLLTAVVYHKNGPSKSKGEGLSVYVPLSGDETRFVTYAQNAAISGDYLRFLEALYGFSAPDNVEIVTPEAAASTSYVRTKTTNAKDYTPGTDMSSSKQQIKYSYEVNDEGYVQIDVTQGSDIIDAAKCNLYWYNEETKTYYFLGSDYTVDINDDWTQFTDGFDGTWVTINGSLCELIITGSNDSYITYCVPVLVNDQKTNLQIMYSFDTEKFEVIGLWDGSVNGLPSRNLRQLKEGDTVDFMFQAKTSLDATATEVVFEGFTVSGDLSITDGLLSDGTYSYSITLEDIFGRETETPWATISLEDDQIYCEFK